MVDVDDMWDDDQDDDAVRAMTFPKCKKPPVDVREYVKGLGMTDDPLIESMARQIYGEALKGGEWDKGDFLRIAKAALAVCRPVIEAPLRAENEKLRAALKLALEYWAHKQQRYKNRHPAWVQAANKVLGETDE